MEVCIKPFAFGLLLAIFLLNTGKTVSTRNVLLKRETALNNIQEVFKKFSTPTKGKGTYYGEYPVGSGACSLDPLPSVYTQKGWIKVAAGKDIFHKSLGCGMCLEITGEGVGSGSNPMKGVYKAVVVDLCGCAPGLDFFIPGDGKWDISYKAIDCPTVQGDDGKILFRMKGSNDWYLKIQVTNAKVPTASFEIFRDDRWYCAKRAADNHFVLGGMGQFKFPLRVRVTSVVGETLGAEIAAISEDDIKTQIQYKAFKDVNGGKPPKLECYGQDDKTASNNDIDEDDEDSVDTSDGDAITAGPDDSLSSVGKDNSASNDESGKSTEAGPKPQVVDEDTINSKEWCKDNKKPDGTYADPFDCTGFIQCAQGNTYKKKCPAGLRFNPKIMNCDKDSNVKCNSHRRHFIEDVGGQQLSLEGEPTPVLSEQSWCSRHQKKDGFYVDPSDCSGFIHCLRGRAFIKKCPPEKLFSQETSTCEFAHLVDCNVRTVLPNDTKVHVGTPNVAREGDSERTSILDSSEKEGEVVVDSKPPVRNDTDNSTMPSENNDSISVPLTSLRLPEALRKIATKIEKGETDAPKKGGDSLEQALNNGGMTEDGTPLFANPSSSNFCGGRFDGRYYVPNKCELFYVCSRGRTYLGSCPSSLQFNSALNTCDNANNVDCRNRLSENFATSRYIEQLNSVDKKRSMGHNNNTVK